MIAVPDGSDAATSSQPVAEAPPPAAQHLSEAQAADLRTGAEAVRLVNGLLWVAAIALVVGGVIIYAILSMATQAQNRAAMQTAQQTFSALLADQAWQLGVAVRDYAFWNETVTNVVALQDPVWIEGNIGAYFNRTFNTGLTLALGGDGRVLTATEGENMLDGFDIGRLGVGVAEVVDGARGAAPDSTGAPRPVTGLGLIDGVPHLLAASRILPETMDAPPSPDPGAVLVAARILEPAALSPLRQRFAMPDLQLVSLGAATLPARQPLLTAGGHALAVATWTPIQPGRDFLRQAMPLLGGAFLLMAGLILAFTVRAVHLSRRLHRDAEQWTRDWSELSRRRLAQDALTAHAPVVLFTLDGNGVLTSLEGDPVLTGSLALALGWQGAVLGLDNGAVLGQPAGLDGMMAAVRKGQAAERELIIDDQILSLLLVPGSRRTGVEWGTPSLASGGAVGVVTDITERRRTEQSLRFTLDRLTRSNAELERFAYVASHDLQEPVRTVVAFAQLLERRQVDSLDAESRDYLRFLVQGARRMQTLVQDLLAYARIGGQAAPAIVNLDDVLDSALATLDGQIVDTGARIRRPSSLPAVRGDAILLQELFQNLLNNALKFRHPERVPEIVVSLAESGPMWLVGIADNGIGIDAAYRDRIFEIFKRLHAGSQFDGTGVGLAICRRVVESHGGTIRLDEGYESGARFLFTLPKAPLAVPSPPEAES